MKKKYTYRIVSHLITIILTCLIFQFVLVQIFSSRQNERQEQFNSIVEANNQLFKEIDMIVVRYKNTYYSDGHNESFLLFFRKSKLLFKRFRSDRRFTCTDLKSFGNQLQKLDESFNIKNYNCDCLSDNVCIEMLIYKLLMHNFKNIIKIIDYQLSTHFQTDQLSFNLLEEKVKYDKEINLKIKQEYYTTDTSFPFIVFEEDTIYPFKDKNRGGNFYSIKISNPKVGKNKIKIKYFSNDWGIKEDFVIDFDYYVEP